MSDRDGDAPNDNAGGAREEFKVFVGGLNFAMNREDLRSGRLPVHAPFLALSQLKLVSVLANDLALVNEASLLCTRLRHA
jgi:hypothetical protein